MSDPLIVAYNSCSTRSGKVVVSMIRCINNFIVLTFSLQTRKDVYSLLFRSYADHILAPYPLLRLSTVSR